MAFGFSGVYNDDEAATVVNVDSTVMPAEPPPKLIATPPEKQLTPQAELEGVIVAAGFTFAEFVAWTTETQDMMDADSWTQWSEVPTEFAKRMLKAQTGLLKGLAMVKGGKA